MENLRRQQSAKYSNTGTYPHHGGGGGGFYWVFLRGLLAPYRKSISIRDVKFHNYNSDKSRDETKKTICYYLYLDIQVYFYLCLDTTNLVILDEPTKKS